MYAGLLELDLLLGDVTSLKQKRSALRPVLTQLRRHGVSAAEVGDHDLHRRAAVGVGVVAADPGHVHEVLDTCERLVAALGDPELLSAHRRLVGPHD